ncbi:TIGR00730 family Rossman fold protein [Rhodoblastus acidophilus]|uniref:LOG family protein n=1 Tax=Rhodoblastus acidophilus TaxID=1074 RepID=UPI001FCEA121|nr:TIGR00730 family Rossman fold protein [Rhodoblastus acidophilus]
MVRYCVFSGSSSGRSPIYAEAAERLGHALAEAGIGLVYGGASVGLMGIIADAVQSRGGEVIGVIPRALVEKEVAHKTLADLRVVETMHQRKALMAELSDGFIALPGGLGTLEELFEVWTWAQLGYHGKPCALLDVGGFYQSLTAFLDHVVAEAFLKPIHRDMLIVEREPTQLLAALRAYRAPQATKWIAATPA